MSAARIPLWIDLRDIPSRRRIPFLRAAARVGAEAILVAADEPEADRPDAIVVDGQVLRREGRVMGSLVTMTDGKAQREAARAKGTVIVEGGDWTIIPLENLIAARQDRPGTLFALTRDPQQAGVFRDTLEHGVHGVALAPRGPADIEAADEVLRQKGVPATRTTAATADDGPTPRSRRQATQRAKVAKTATPVVSGGSTGARGGKRPSKTSQSTKKVGAPRAAEATAETDAAHLALEPAEVVSVEDAGPGDRICVDATSAFRPGEGLLVGSTARSFALVHAETLESEFVAARPFRVNAGALHSYILAADGRTAYLSELRAGSRVTAVDAQGMTRTVTVGRAKLEHRPHLLVRWRGPSGEGSAVLQNAETIRLVRPDGGPAAVTQLQAGDVILVHHEHAARHFGMPVEERLEER